MYWVRLRIWSLVMIWGHDKVLGESWGGGIGESVGINWGMTLASSCMPACLHAKQNARTYEESEHRQRKKSETGRDIGRDIYCYAAMFLSLYSRGMALLSCILTIPHMSYGQDFW